MPKHLTSPSPSKKLYYAAAPGIVKANKVRKMRKHLKKYPNDKQTAGKLEAIK